MTTNRPVFTDTPEDQPRLSSRRIKITLPTAPADKLAHRAGEPAAKVAAQIIRKAFDNDEDRRAPWLEPYGGSREWRGLTWGSIVGLHTRYPTPSPPSKDGRWRTPPTLRH